MPPLAPCFRSTLLTCHSGAAFGNAIILQKLCNIEIVNDNEHEKTLHKSNQTLALVKVDSS
jgi:hypothetical protein